MKTMRQALRDRLTSGAFALSLAYLLVLHGVLASMALGAMAAAMAGPVDVVCTAGGLLTVTPGGDGDVPGGEALCWHCATLCQSASSAAPAFLGAQTAFAYPLSQQGIATGPTPADISPSAPQALIAEARAPPSFI